MVDQLTTVAKVCIMCAMKIETFLRDVYIPEAERTLKPRSVIQIKDIFNRCVIPLVGSLDLEEIAYTDATKILTHWRKTPVQANRAFSWFSTAMSLAVKHNLRRDNPCFGATLYREKPRERFLTKVEAKRLRTVLEGMPQLGARIIEIVYWTGARPAEIRDADWGWLPPIWDWTRGITLRHPDAKRGARNIFLPPPAMLILAHLDTNNSYRGSIFPPHTSTRRPWDNAAKVAGLTGVRLYDLRHTFASAALAMNVSLLTIGRLLGHKNAQTTLRYAHLDNDAGLDAAAKAATWFSETAGETV